jgi:predicted Zn-dependent protease with MMP-like domain
MSPEEFDELVAEAVESLPEQFLSRLDNVDVVVAEEPTPGQLAENGLESGETLFGLYEGVSLVDRAGYGEVLPDKITIFQRPLEESYAEPGELIEQIRLTVAHEIAHHFGISDEELDEWGLG